MTNYNIADEVGTDYTVGLQGDLVARRTAQRLADQHGKSVYLYEVGSDDEPEEIEPTDATDDIDVEIESAVGPRIVYPASGLASDVDDAAPEGWEIDWDTTPAQCGRGRLSSPLRRVSVPTGEEIEDPTGATVRCACGEATGHRCAWSGPTSETVIVEWMPEHLRASHAAAGNRGVYPHNGARRIRVERTCADAMVRDDGEWCEIVVVRQ